MPTTRRKQAGAAGGEPGQAKPAPRPVRAKAATKPFPPEVLQLRIWLRDIAPPIWRQVLVPACLTFDDFHDVIQAAMGWEWDHAYCFQRVGPRGRLGEDIDGPEVLGRILARPRQRVAYEYDFGDGWLHLVELEKRVPYAAARHYPYCLDGARACPLEDCGGVFGYQRVLEALRNPSDDNAGWREWIGRYDPEAFSAVAVNRRWAKWRKLARSQCHRA